MNHPMQAPVAVADHALGATTPDISGARRLAAAVVENLNEVNRATPRSQSALLEAMEERQVSVDGTSHPLPSPFVLIATQNPFDHAGTFPLLEGQRDRFALVLELGHPGRDAEREVLLGLGG